METAVIIEFLEIIDQMDSQAEVIERLESILVKYGFEYYGLVRRPMVLDDPLSLILASRWPEGWPRRYLRKKYSLIDPTVRYLGHARRGFNWKQAIPAFEADPHWNRMQRMMADARNHGLEGGYNFPVHGRQGLLGCLSVGGKPVDLSVGDMIEFEALAKAVFWRILELVDPKTHEDLSSAVEVSLTQREMEALLYLADGLTSIEIAQVLELSNHTVDWYMNALQQKLKAKNRQHAVAIGFRLGLLS
ncbi:LuxR family transcriptional regulator [Hoeflea prorocentri]|uniref:LuxR family transcriptional regulator n=1 Tax=Hoeflea prorocentri TaxID=1922333 RepID=A0A9X3UN93_9HYPH|nr:LuxR family transcriptional regulator [Hoeflea prorocentri]MCY6383510.1 LuxR family transcriptional regulator [Hoeflea prorocentri]MDA5401310.1 LuxR family transcriptional regulator [Hoeflea prorocentri]